MRSRILVATTCTILLALCASAVAGPRITGVGLKAGVGLVTLSNDRTNYAAFIDGIDLTPLEVDLLDGKHRTGLRFGGFAVLDLGSNLTIQIELIYTSKGIEVETAKVQDVEGARAEFSSLETVRLTYLEVPLLLKYEIPLRGKVRPSLFAGPALSFRLSGEYEVDFEWVTSGPRDMRVDVEGEADISNMESLDAALVFGGETATSVGSFEVVLDIRYSLGLRRVFHGIDMFDIPHILPSEGLPDNYPIVDYYSGDTEDFKNRSFSIMVGVAYPL